jgi:uncharacterized oligopeptide transporter (OPT) family protein
MNAKKYFSILAISFVFMFFLAACGNKDPLVGSWQEPVSGITLAFDKNNNVVISLNETSYTMQYSEQDPNILDIKVTSDGTIPDMTMKYTINQDELILTVNGVDTVFQRLR